MRAAIAAVAWIALATCVTPPSAFPCQTSDQCNPGGTCQPTGFCSFSDATCASGQRYGDAAGSLSGTCVGEEPGTPDAATVTCDHDGTVDSGEQCDDGDMDSTDGCVDCAWARCGDDAVWTGVEDCDDGNTADGDACGSSCITCGGDASVVWPVNGHCYMRVDGADEWDAAVFACDQLGGYLASYGSAEENDFVAGALVNGDHWIGLDDNMTEAELHWQDDVEIGVGSLYDNFAAGEPNGAAVENCVYQNATGAWLDGVCTTPLPFICERNTWAVDPTTHHVYLHVGGNIGDEDYAGAVAACQARAGSHLVSITTLEEQTVVDAISNATSFWIGLNDVTTEGAYVWESPEPFSYAAWSVPNGEPDGAADPVQDCASLRDDSAWYDGQCGSMRGYMCELAP
jgi:hypothetical protein